MARHWNPAHYRSPLPADRLPPWLLINGLLLTAIPMRRPAKLSPEDVAAVREVRAIVARAVNPPRVAWVHRDGRILPAMVDSAWLARRQTDYFTIAAA